MILLLLLIFLVLAGAVAVDVVTTVAGGAIAAIILIIVLVVRSNARARQAQQRQPAAPPERSAGRICGDCKYCFGQIYRSADNQEIELFTCVAGHPNPQAGYYAVACESDFLSRR